MGMDEQLEEELGYEAQSLNHEAQREQIIAEIQEYNRQLQAENKQLKTALGLWLKAAKASTTAHLGKDFFVAIEETEQALKG